MAKAKLLPYQQAAEWYIYIMSATLLCFSCYFLYGLALQGALFAEWTSFLFAGMVIISLVCIALAGRLARYFSKKQTDQAVRAWELRMLPMLGLTAAVIVAFLLARRSGSQIFVHMVDYLVLILVPLYLLYVGIDSNRHGVLYGYRAYSAAPRIVAEGQTAKRIGKGMIVAGSMLILMCSIAYFSYLMQG